MITPPPSQEHAEQGLGVVGGVALPVAAVGSVEGRQVELVDYVAHEPGEVAGRQPLAQVGREQERLVTVTGKESCRPWRTLPLFKQLPDALLLGCQLRHMTPKTGIGGTGIPSRSGWSDDLA
jgi:hypothetical protein